MSKKHDAIFDDVLKGLDAKPEAEQGRAGARFLARQSRVADRLSSDTQEKTLRWVDPADCRMWARHNRAYDLLNEDNCRDLIDGIRAQGQQEFPAIVRRLDGDVPYEVICGARRHFAISWLRANNYPQFKYLVDVRDLTDEEAFRLADIENRDRADISDYERARDYAEACKLYYGGKQKAMAARLEVSEAWLSRYLQLARLPQQIVVAFGDIRELRELHARALKPWLSDPDLKARVLEEAAKITAEGARQPGAQIMARLKAAVTPKQEPAEVKTYRRSRHEAGVRVQQKGGKVRMEFAEGASKAALTHAFEAYLKDRFGG
ncbi:ParB/RepB/Spo0J family partition protein [Thalassococcus sp. S3]|uniref:ParB/RepB/Spo0J family partition protein n=1 Tax=Thalassococcus sp. S3 TaxID=2017482 RepID=UPI00102489BD|nr:ParB/RepB/Spo0J family partition protein [Thalassococcus sp. S3]QBF34282.1 chromosome partitioning protein ParB [Thalassococcus sp. S3]